MPTGQIPLPAHPNLSNPSSSQETSIQQHHSETNFQPTKRRIGQVQSECGAVCAKLRKLTGFHGEHERPTVTPEAEDVVEGRQPLHIRISKYKDSFPDTCTLCLSEYIQNMCEMFEIDTNRFVNPQNLSELAQQYKILDYPKNPHILKRHQLHLQKYK